MKEPSSSNTLLIMLIKVLTVDDKHIHGKMLSYEDRIEQTEVLTLLVACATCSDYVRMVVQVYDSLFITQRFLLSHICFMLHDILL